MRSSKIPRETGNTVKGEAAPPSLPTAKYGYTPKIHIMDERTLLIPVGAVVFSYFFQRASSCKIRRNGTLQQYCTIHDRHRNKSYDTKKWYHIHYRHYCKANPRSLAEERISTTSRIDIVQ